MIKIEPKPANKISFPREITVKITILNESDYKDLKRELAEADLYESGLLSEDGDELTVLTEVAKSIDFQL